MSLTASTSMSAVPSARCFSRARNTLRPIRPKPLIPILMVTGRCRVSRGSPSGRGSAGCTDVPAGSATLTKRTSHADPTAGGVRNRSRPPAGARLVRATGRDVDELLLVLHLRGDGAGGVGHAHVLGLLVGHRQQPPDAPGDRVLGH